MAVSYQSPLITYNMNTALGAHQAMLALHAHLTKVGLSRATTGADYNVAGDETQIPTTYPNVSNWLAYHFTDPAQSSFPITVWFRIVRGKWSGSTSSSEAYGFQSRISEGLFGGAPLGAVLENFDGVANNTGGGTSPYPSTYSNSNGDFIRYSGSALTILFGVYQWQHSFGPGNTLIEMHLERRYSVVDGAVGRGFCGWFSTGGPGQSGMPMWASAGVSLSAHPQSRSLYFVSSSDVTNIFMADAYARCVASPLILTGGAAVVAPVPFLDQNARPTVASKLFTAARSVFTQRQPVTLDFSGTDKVYLPYNPGPNPNNVFPSSLTFLFEWE